MTCLEFFQPKKQKQKGMLKSEQSLRDLLNIIKYTNIYVKGIPKERRDKGKDTERTFERILGKIAQI